MEWCQAKFKAFRPSFHASVSSIACWGNGGASVMQNGVSQLVVWCRKITDY